MTKLPLPKKTLYYREWLVLFAILGFLLASVSISFLSDIRVEKILNTKSSQNSNEVLVLIEGEVAKPGEYAINAGFSVEKLLKLAKPKKFADLSKINKKEKLYQSCKISIPKLEKITITLEGAVQNPGKIRMPPGSRLFDLREKIEFMDPSISQEKFFNKNRLLKNGEIIKVPETK